MSVGNFGTTSKIAEQEPTGRRWRRNPKWLVAPFDDSVVLLDIDSGKYFGLNRSAAAIWNALDEYETAAAIEVRLRQRFDVAPDVCAAAVERGLRQLSEMGAVLPA